MKSIGSPDALPATLPATLLTTLPATLLTALPATLLAALLTALPAPASAQSCTLVDMAPESASGAATGSVSGYVLDGPPLCYFIDRPGVSGTARLLGDNACFVADDGGDCTRDHRFRVGAGGLRVMVYQERLAAGHAYFTLQIALD